MKRSILIFGVFFLFALNTTAQSEGPPKFGNLTIGIDASNIIFRGSNSIHTEVRLYSSHKGGVHIYAKAGLQKGYFTEILCAADEFTGKFGGLDFVYGFGNHHFEINTGLSFISEVEEYESSGNLFFDCGPSARGNVLALVDLGYRYQKPGDSLIFRAYVGILGIGLGIGYAFL